ncbi:OmpA family protein [Ekhidna sp.]
MENITTDTQIHGYSIKRVFSLLLLLAISTVSFAQSGLSTDSKKAKKLYEKADKKYKERDFLTAISYLEESVRQDSEFFEAYIRMGSLYNAMGQEDSVYSKFQLYEKTALDPIASVLERLAFMAFDRGEYGKAESFLNKFLVKVPERESSRDIDLLIRSIRFAKKELKKPVDSIELKILPSEVNRFKLQYLPSITVDNASMFFTKRDYVQGDEDIVVSHFVDGKWTPAESISPRINSSLNEGACAVSADGRTMIFTSCDGKYSLGSCDLYITRKVGDNWSKPKNLGKPINSRYWESQPSLSADGKTLYFSSNRTGGLGGRDIWVSKSADGKWSVPINLGGDVNTPKDETTPFIHPNGSDLYFSANSYPGMGGYDLFVSSKTDSLWSIPRNLGFPINTFKDEVAIIIGAEGQMAYFAKEEQKNFEILDSKIVSITLPKEIRPDPVSYNIGRVTDKETLIPLKAEVEIIDLNTNKVIYRNESDSLTGSYLMIVPAGLELAAYVKKKGYLYSDFHFTTQTNKVSEPDTINIKLKPISEGESLILKNIYFDIDSYEIKKKSISELDNAYQLLIENPDMIVEIAGHTDDIGSKNYNQQLSEKRAGAVYDMLTSKGISRSRISFKGYADLQPLLPNTTDSNRKSNRRIEFRVLRVNQ